MITSQPEADRSRANPRPSKFPVVAPFRLQSTNAIAYLPERMASSASPGVPASSISMSWQAAKTASRKILRASASSSMIKQRSLVINPHIHSSQTSIVSVFAARWAVLSTFAELNRKLAKHADVLTNFSGISASRKRENRHTGARIYGA